jgi:hypothetical protein
MFEPVPDQSVIRLPAIGVDGRRACDLAVNHPYQLGFRAVGHDLDKHLARPLEQADDGNFPASAAPAFAAHPARPEITLINFHDAADKRLGFDLGQSRRPLPQQTIKPMGGVL